jgi:Chaperone of endosialidase
MGSQATSSNQVQQTSQQSQQQGRSVSQPIDWAQGLLRGLGTSVYNTGTSINPYTPPSANTSNFWNAATQLGNGGVAGLGSMPASFAADTLGGKYLDLSSNPYLQANIDYAQQPAITAFNKQVLPGIGSMFSGSGRTPEAGNLAGDAVATATDSLARNLAGAATQAGYNNYAQERSNQLNVLSQLPGLNSAAWQNVMGMGQAGQAEDAYTQAQKMAPLDLLTRTGLGVLSLAPGGVTDSSGSSSGSGTTYGYGTTNNGGDSWLGAALGLGMKAAPLIFSSDRRDKTDIDELGIDPLTGLPMYAYRYKSDPKTYPKVVGPMAQDMAERDGPWRVRGIGGHKVVAGGLV